MAVGFKVGFFWFEIGNGDFLHCFFSTIAVNLENNNWGSKFPVIMNELYQGHLDTNKIDEAINELKTIKKQLKNLSTDKVVWDIENLSLLPPWKDNISNEITDLSNYFVTSDGDDFLTIFMHALEKGKELNMCIEIDSL